MDSLSFISDICGALKKVKRTGWVKHSIPLPESDADHMHRCAMCALLLEQPADPRDNYVGSNQQFHPTKVDKTKLLRMAVTHDLCEALAGDITPFCDPSLVNSKHEKEDQAMKAIQKVVGDPLGNELYQLWKEYEQQSSVEAVYCKDIDKFEMVVQAFEYEKEHLLSPEDAKRRGSINSDVNQANNVRGDPPASKKAKMTDDSSATTNGNNSKKPYKGDIRQDVFSEPLRGFFQSTNSVIKTPLFRRLDAELRDRRKKFLIEKGWTVTDQEKQQPMTENGQVV